MEKIYFLPVILSLASGVFAQCNQNELDELPTIYSKGYSANYKPTAEQDKWMTTIFTTIIEPALKSTKGLRGKWEPMGGFKKTPGGFINSTIQMYMGLLVCRGNKLQEAREIGLVINFTLNDFSGISKSEIAAACSHEEDKWVNTENTKKETVAELVNGTQVYYAEPKTETELFPDVTFYKKTEDAEYFLVSKTGVPLFITLTNKQALEINKKNAVQLVEFYKQQLQMPSLRPATKADYEKKMAKDFADYRTSIPDPEKFITDLINDLEKIKPDMLKGIQTSLDFAKTALSAVAGYLNTAPANELEKLCMANSDILNRPFNNALEIKSELVYNSKKNGMLVTLNPAYFSKTISTTAPQFICIELRRQSGGAAELRAIKTFKNNLDFSKLQSLLVK